MQTGDFITAKVNPNKTNSRKTLFYFSNVQVMIIWLSPFDYTNYSIPATSPMIFNIVYLFKTPFIFNSMKRM